jgi:hypothetical protein
MSIDFCRRGMFVIGDAQTEIFVSIGFDRVAAETVKQVRIDEDRSGSYESCISFFGSFTAVYNATCRCIHVLMCDAQCRIDTQSSLACELRRAALTLSSQKRTSRTTTQTLFRC